MTTVNPLTGAAYLWRGLRWLVKPGIRAFVIIPLLVNTLLFSGAIYLISSGFGSVMDWLLGYLPTWLDWLRWLLWPLFALTVLLVSFYTFSLTANLLASPFNSMLAEKVEALASTDRTPRPSPSWWHEITTAPVVEFKKLLYFLLWAMPLLLLFLIPGLNLAAPFLWAAFSAWLLAQQYLDYPMSNHAIPLPEQRRLLRQQRVLALGFGGAVLLMTLLPVVNFLAMPAAVIGATLLWVEQFAGRAAS
jgi:CysZ protein